MGRRHEEAAVPMTSTLFFFAFVLLLFGLHMLKALGRKTDDPLRRTALRLTGYSWLLLVLIFTVAHFAWEHSRTLFGPVSHMSDTYTSYYPHEQEGARQWETGGILMALLLPALGVLLLLFRNSRSDAARQLIVHTAVRTLGHSVLLLLAYGLLHF